MKSIEERMKDMAEGRFQPAAPVPRVPRITRHVLITVESPVHPVSAVTTTAPIAPPEKAPPASSYDLLLSCGLPDKEARKWAARRDHEYIERLARYAKRTAKINMAGYVWRALREDWSIPL